MRERDWLALVIQALMGACGGLVRTYQMKEPRPWKETLANTCAAAFMGICLYWVAQALNLPEAAGFAAAGIAGLQGPKLWDALLPMVVKRVTGIDVKAGEPSELEKDNSNG